MSWSLPLVMRVPIEKMEVTALRSEKGGRSLPSALKRSSRNESLPFFSSRPRAVGPPSGRTPPTGGAASSASTSSASSSSAAQLANRVSHVFIEQTHVSGSDSGSISCGSRRHLRHVRRSHWTQFHTGLGLVAPLPAAAGVVPVVVVVVSGGGCWCCRRRRSPAGPSAAADGLPAPFSGASALADAPPASLDDDDGPAVLAVRLGGFGRPWSLSAPRRPPPCAGG
mmetsp:Transcript_3646/g.14269  ORF Transcript_3646/g.14269 Transcript_3646/m.14269 type:complete len:225 (+) Transcript_3646:1455-2129(+)